MHRHTVERGGFVIQLITPGDPEQNNLNNRKAELIYTAVECSVTCTQPPCPRACLQSSASNDNIYVNLVGQWD